MVTVLTALLISASPVAPIEEAIPASAKSALFVQRFGTELEPAVDALERILDPGEAEAFIDTAPLPAMALYSLQGDDDFGLDRRSGLALFRPDGFPVAVGVAPLSNKERALAALEKTLVSHGIRPAEQLEQGMLRYRLHGNVDVIVYVRGGFLFMVMPDTDVQMSAADLLRAATIVSGAKEPSLAKSEAFAKLRARVSPKGVQLFVRQPLGETSVAEAALVSATFDDRGTYLDGFVATSSDVLRATDGKGRALLSSAPAGPALILSTRVLSNELSRWLGTGDQGFGEKLSAAGIAPSVLAAALTGDSQLAFYVDPELLLVDAMASESRVGPIGTILAHAGVADSKLTTALLGTLMKARGEKFSRTLEKGGTRLKARVEGEPVEARVTNDEVRLWAGPQLKGRKSVDVLAPYRSLLPAGAFGPGHVSAVIDLSQVRADLELGVSSGDDELDAYQRLLARTVEQLTSVERAALDLGPELGGARFTGTLLYRSGKLGRLMKGVAP